MHTEDSITFGYEGNKLTLLPNLHSWNNDLVEVYKDSKVLYLEVSGFEHVEGESYIQAVCLDMEEMKLLRDYLTHKIELMEGE